MKCKLCEKKAVNSDLCSLHFVEFFESTVYDTVDRYKLLKKSDKVAVAVSGGKDSLAILLVLSKKYDVEGIAIDEGIKGYRENTIEILKKFCALHKIPLKIYSFKKEFGYSLDEILKKTGEKPCTVCGVFRRYLLNKYSRKYSVIATGHNLDDESQVILMNLFKNQIDIMARMGPKTGIVKDKKFVPRVKPLYFLSEKQVMAYTILTGIPTNMTECPYAFESYRAKIRDVLNDFEAKHKGIKINIVNKYLGLSENLKKKFSEDEKMTYCSVCFEPSRQEICNACKTVDKIRLAMKTKVNNLEGF